MKVYWLGKQLMNREGTLIDVYAHPRRNEPEWSLMSKDDLKTHNERVATEAFKAARKGERVEHTPHGFTEVYYDYDSDYEYLQSPEYKALVGEV